MSLRISRKLSPDDLEWALDHSRRRYRVRVARPDDNPNLKGSEHFLAVVPVNGATPSVMAPRCGLFPHDWRDDDDYAVARLDAIARSGALRHQRELPTPDAVRLGHDFGDWCAELFRGGRIAGRKGFPTLAEATAEVERLAATGLRRLPDSVTAAHTKGATA